MLRIPPRGVCRRVRRFQYKPGQSGRTIKRNLERYATEFEFLHILDYVYLDEREAPCARIPRHRFATRPWYLYMNGINLLALD